jgi:hypothetical protein
LRFDPSSSASPATSPPPAFRILRNFSVDVRLDGDVAKRPELHLTDLCCSLKPAASSLIHALKNGMIEKIVLHDGIPRRVFLRGPLPGGA